MPIQKFKDALNYLKEVGIKNVLALRGDPPKGSEWMAIEGGFENALDLVKFIREEHGDYFSIGVAGYPEGHPDARSYEEELYYLKEKVDAGADLIISQLFYDTEMFLKWVKDCRNIGINVPILPGIMPIHTYGGFKRMTGFCKTFIPDSVRTALEPIKNDDVQVKAFGIKLAVTMCRRLLEGGIKGLHFYTLNLESSVPAILEELGLIRQEQIEKPRSLPWKKEKTRKGEEVRPVFWANRPKSYIKRTASWDEFPNGRWGDARSPSFAGAEDLGGHSHTEKEAEQWVSNWGPLESERDLWAVFVRYLRGEVTALPWSEGPLAGETGAISQDLLMLNTNGFLTINSQPRVNGLPSTHPVHGWGSWGGYVYQRAYVEFFCPADHWKKLKQVLESRPMITFHAINFAGDVDKNTIGVTALTWGAFPGQEVKQPTVVDPEVFENYWKHEAYQLWRERWLDLVPPETKTRQVLSEVIDTYYLVNIVDNDYVAGNIFSAFHDLIASGQLSSPEKK